MDLERQSQVPELNDATEKAAALDHLARILVEAYFYRKKHGGKIKYD